MNGTRQICRLTLAMFAVLSISTLALAQTAGLTNRSTDLRASPEDSAKLIRTLPEKTSVELLEKRGPWNRVRSGADQGFIRMMHMGGGATVVASESTASGNALAGFNKLLGGDRSGGTRAQAATVGVRGFTKDDVQRAQPDDQAVARMKQFQVSLGDAQSFASQGRLAFRSVAYLAKDAVAMNSGARK
jgi:hypothetical protein